MRRRRKDLWSETGQVIRGKNMKDFVECILWGAIKGLNTRSNMIRYIVWENYSGRFEESGMQNSKTTGKAF